MSVILTQATGGSAFKRAIDTELALIRQLKQIEIKMRARGPQPAAPFDLLFVPSAGYVLIQPRPAQPEAGA